MGSSSGRGRARHASLGAAQLKRRVVRRAVALDLGEGEPAAQ
jgi:hypothetical protein